MTNGIRKTPIALKKLYQKQFLQCAGTSDYFAGYLPADIQTVAHSRVIAHQWNTLPHGSHVAPKPLFCADGRRCNFASSRIVHPMLN